MSRTEYSIKRFIFCTLLAFSYCFAGLFYFLVRTRNKKTALIIPPAYTAGSLGDEAMMTVLFTQLIDSGYEKIGLINFANPYPNYSPVFESLYKKVAFHHHPLKYFNSLSAASLLKLVSKYDTLIMVGADVMDGFYCPLTSESFWGWLSFAGFLGKKSIATGFSFNGNPPPSVESRIRRLNKNVQLFARDPVSYERLQKFVNNPQQLHLTADLAFLLPPADSSQHITPALTYIKREHAAKRLVIGVNINPKFFSPDTTLAFNKAQELLEQLFVSSKHPISYILLYHDYNSNDPEYAQQFFTLCSASKTISDHITVIPTGLNAAEIKAICAQLDMVISCKMHLAIATLSSGVPATCIAYQGKFEGMYKHLGLSGQIIEANIHKPIEEFSHFFATQVNNYSEIKNCFVGNIPAVKELSAQQLLKII